MPTTPGQLSGSKSGACMMLVTIVPDHPLCNNFAVLRS